MLHLLIAFSTTMRNTCLNLNGGRALATSANAPRGGGSSGSHAHSILHLWVEVKQRCGLVEEAAGVDSSLVELLRSVEETTGEATEAPEGAFMARMKESGPLATPPVEPTRSRSGLSREKEKPVPPPLL